MAPILLGDFLKQMERNGNNRLKRPGGGIDSGQKKARRRGPGEKGCLLGQFAMNEITLDNVTWYFLPFWVGQVTIWKPLKRDDAESFLLWRQHGAGGVMLDPHDPALQETNLSVTGISSDYVCCDPLREIGHAGD